MATKVHDHKTPKKQFVTNYPPLLIDSSKQKQNEQGNTEIQFIVIFTPNLKLFIMKKLLLSAALFAGILSTSFAQITLPPVQIPAITGGTVIPLFQGVGGNYMVEGQLLPRVIGSLTSADIEATLTGSTNLTYANDLAIVVTSGPDLQTATVLLQIGGFSNFTANKIDWPCAPACDTNVIGTVVSGSVTFPGIDFASSQNVIWLANGYVNANPATNTGAWDLASLTLGGISFGNVSIESNVPVSAVAYPNPASDVLNVIVEGEEVVSVAVIAMDGKVVSNNQGSTALVADLTAGMYIYEARTASGAIIRNTFVKK
jgi:hypothetical protein